MLCCIVMTGAVLDADLDGDEDLVVGRADGTLVYYKQNDMGEFELLSGWRNPFDGIDVGSNSKPAFLDVDGDGDRDLLLGNQDGEIVYFENTLGQGKSRTAALAVSF